jgi:hypothetical protein
MFVGGSASSDTGELGRKGGIEGWILTRAPKSTLNIQFSTFCLFGDVVAVQRPQIIEVGVERIDHPGGQLPHLGWPPKSFNSGSVLLLPRAVFNVRWSDYVWKWQYPFRRPFDSVQ